jgi:hypothetical protein
MRDTPLKLFLIPGHKLLLLHYVLLNHFETPPLLQISKNIIDSHCIDNLEVVGKDEDNEVGGQARGEKVADEEQYFRKGCFPPEMAKQRL